MDPAMKKVLFGVTAPLLPVILLAGCLSFLGGHDAEPAAQPAKPAPTGTAPPAYSPKDGRGHRLVVYVIPMQIDKAATPELAARFLEGLEGALGDLGTFEFRNAAEPPLNAYEDTRDGGDAFRNGAIREPWRREIFQQLKPDFILSGSVSVEEKGDGAVTFLRITDAATGYPTLLDFHFSVSRSAVDLSDHVAYHAQRIRKTQMFSDRVTMTNRDIVEILRVHSPDSYALLAGLERQGGNDILDYMSFSVPLASDLEGLIHEGSHFFSNWKNRNELFINASETIVVPVTPVFPSMRLAERIPLGLRTFRYDHYVESESPYQTTQNMGIYGLLDEMLAYYHGTRTAYDMYAYCRESADPDYLVPLSEYLSAIYATYYAYYEFRFFILTYLLYARDKEPAVFQGITANRQFLAALRRVDGLYARLIARIHDREAEIAGLGKEMGFTFIIEGDNSLFYDRERYRLGAMNHRSTIALLEKEMADPRYADPLKMF